MNVALLASAPISEVLQMVLKNQGDLDAVEVNVILTRLLVEMQGMQAKIDALEEKNRNG